MNKGKYGREDFEELNFEALEIGYIFDFCNNCILKNLNLRLLRLAIFFIFVKIAFCFSCEHHY